MDPGAVEGLEAAGELGGEEGSDDNFFLYRGIKTDIYVLITILVLLLLTMMIKC